METSVRVKLRPSTVYGRKGSLFIQFIKDRKVRTVTTSYKIYKKEWNNEKQSICIDPANLDRAKLLGEMNTSLKSLIDDLEKRIRQLEDNGSCTMEDIISLYSNHRTPSMLCGFVKKLKKELFLNSQSRTAEAYQSVCNTILKYNKGKDIPLDEIDNSFVKKFESYMKIRGNSLNTISFYIRNLRSIYNKAVRDHVIERPKENPFDGTFTGVCKTRKRAAKKEIFEKLFSIEFPPKGAIAHSLSFSRDVFLLSFLLRGISFIDLAYLRKKDMTKDRITYIRKKTKQKLEIALTPQIREIINRYANECQNSEFLLPILASGSGRKSYINALRRQNYGLKKLSQLIGMDQGQCLTTYVARHSWASIARAKGYPVAIISQGLGHDSEKTTLIYLDSFDYTLLDKVNREMSAILKKVS